MKTSFLEINEVAQLLVNKGWAEKNAGNFSIRLTDFTKGSLPPFHNSIILPFPYKKKLKDNISFLVSSTGAKFRDIAKSTQENYVILEYRDGEVRYSFNEKEAMPSSEYATHLLIHNYLQDNKPEKQVILHTHPTHLIAYSHKYDHYSKTQINDLLERMIPEIVNILPRGIGVVEFRQSGSPELAEATLKEFVNHDIILWKKHGCVAVANTLWDAFDLIDIVDKAAHIALLI